MIVVAYFNAINAHDYRAAWDLGGKNLGGSYAAFAAGFADTVSDTVHIVDNTNTTVRITLDALQTDGSVKSFAGTYTVRGGEIVGASVQQTAQPSGAATYKNCTEAHNDGRYSIPRTDPAYAPHLDRDKDGLACEPNEGP